MYWMIRISMVYRGRAIPIIWKVLEHPSSSVAYDVYKDLLDRSAQLLPLHCKGIFCADRGFADTPLMAHRRSWNWHWRIRIKGSCWIDRGDDHRSKVNRIALSSGEARFWHGIYIPARRDGPVHLAMARSPESTEQWFVVSDEPTDMNTFEEYGLRFDSEENFLDNPSHGFPLESSLIRSAEALERLCCVLAVATLYLVSQGVEVVTQGKRQWVDPHWFRGSSYLKIGWHWVTRARSHGYELMTRVQLSAEADPEPARASKSQPQPRRFFVRESQDAAA